ncbi:hypothetical protein GWI33_001620 [Rhynchophorus ferrugineus]|uniref:Uncharacterized protein n=1 Tax=Rhynchophorus ferrugineus TaxID=354439 RepID=A0A834IZ24_RHYFE|nr:hypothetical protein GWI33_001620 [Rhynchophorus ferrugineus]
MQMERSRGDYFIETLSLALRAPHSSWRTKEMNGAYANDFGATAGRPVARACGLAVGAICNPFGLEPR